MPDLRGYNLSEKPEGVSSYKVLYHYINVMQYSAFVNVSQVRDLAEDVTGIIQFYKKEKVHLVAHDWVCVWGSMFIIT